MFPCYCKVSHPDKGSLKTCIIEPQTGTTNILWALAPNYTENIKMILSDEEAAQLKTWVVKKLEDMYVCYDLLLTYDLHI